MKLFLPMFYFTWLLLIYFSTGGEYSSAGPVTFTNRLTAIQPQLKLACLGGAALPVDLLQNTTWTTSARASTQDYPLRYVTIQKSK